MNAHASFLLAVALASCAASAQAQAADPASAATPAQAQESPPAKAKAADDAHCLRYTGSYIVASKNKQDDMRNGSAGHRHCISAAGRVYTREDMQNTGQTDIGQALRMLDPAVH